MVQFWAKADEDDTVYAPSFSVSTKSLHEELVEHCFPDCAPAAPGKLKNIDAADDMVTSAGTASDRNERASGCSSELAALLLSSSWHAYLFFAHEHTIVEAWNRGRLEEKGVVQVK